MQNRLLCKKSMYVLLEVSIERECQMKCSAMPAVSSAVESLKGVAITVALGGRVLWITAM